MMENCAQTGENKNCVDRENMSTASEKINSEAQSKANEKNEIDIKSTISNLESTGRINETNQEPNECQLPDAYFDQGKIVGNKA